MTTEAVFTIREAAAYLKVTAQTIRNWIKQGALPCLRVMGAIRISKASIDRMLEGNEHK